MGIKVLNINQARWLRAYLGRDPRYTGNASASYRLAYPGSSAKTSQVSSSKMMNHPLVKIEIAKYKQAQSEQNIADANYVLSQSVRLYDRAMGDIPIEIDVIDTIRQDDGTLANVTRTVERRDYNPAIARQALELIGRHTSVQAFQDNVEHKHTHRLEQALARRGKAVEARAEARTIEHAPVGQVPAQVADDPLAPGVPTDPLANND